MFHLPASASSPVIKAEQGLGDPTTKEGYNWPQYIPKSIWCFRAAFLVLQQIFSTFTSNSKIVASAKVYFAFSAAIFCFTLLFSFNDCRDTRCSSNFIPNKALSPQLAQNLSVVPAATVSKGDFCHSGLKFFELLMAKTVIQYLVDLATSCVKFQSFLLHL